MAVETFIVCDVCLHGGPAHFDEAPDEVRRMAFENGWVVREHGDGISRLDLCPDHRSIPASELLAVAEGPF